MDLNVIITKLDCLVIRTCNGLSAIDPLKIATGGDGFKDKNNVDIIKNYDINRDFEVALIVKAIKKLGVIYGIILLLVSIIGLIFLESAQGRDEQKKKIMHILKGLFILGSMTFILNVIYKVAEALF